MKGWRWIVGIHCLCLVWFGWLGGCSDFLGTENKERGIENPSEFVSQEPVSLPDETLPDFVKEGAFEPEEREVSRDDAGQEQQTDATEYTPEEPPESTKQEENPDAVVVQVRGCGIKLRVRSHQFSQQMCDRPVPGQITSIVWAGDVSQWKPLVSLQAQADGWWEGELQTRSGDHAYKYVLNGEVWCLDPQNAKQKYENGVANSWVHVPDCNLPLLGLEKLEAPENTGRLAVDIRYWDGTGQKGFDPTSVTVSMNGTPLNTGVQVGSDGQIKIRLDSLNHDRYTFRVQAKDRAGQATETLYFFAWVEKEKFLWQDATLYFVFVDRFANGDTSNDAPIQGVGSIANYLGGDLQGVLDKIKSGYFKDLGVNALWLSPLYEHPNQAEKGGDGRLYTGFHGYWPTEPRMVAKRFGSMTLLTALVREAHKQGIRVLVDLATNHVHREHPYWKQHEKNGWFHPFSPCAPAWDKPIECWFDPFLPDIDYRNFDAATQMIDDAVYWAQIAELDGFRVDAVKHMRNIAMFNLRARLEEQVTHGQYHFYMVGETYAGGWKDGGDLIKGFISEQMLSGQFDFPLYWEIVGTIARRDGGTQWKRLDQVIRESMDSRFYGSQAIMSGFLGNHDVPRFISHANGDIASMWGGDRNKAWTQPPAQPSNTEPYDRIKLAWTLLFALPGIPLLYYGDEIGLAGEADPDNRRMMPWTQISALQQSVLTHLKTVSNLRRRYPALRSLSRKTLFVDDERYAFLRESGSQRIIVALRRGGNQDKIAIPVTGLLSTGQTVTDLLRNTTASVTQGEIVISLQPNEATFLLLP